MRYVEVGLGLLELIEVIICQTAVVVVDSAFRVMLNGLLITVKRLLKFFVLKIGQTQVVIGGRLLSFGVDGLFEIFNRLIQITLPPIANTSIESAIINLIFIIAICPNRRCEVLDRLIHLV